MKHLYAVLLGLSALLVFPQAPQYINYQGIARDGSGAPVTNTVIGLQFSISTATNPAFHSETQLAVQVNSLGLFSTKIGISPQLPSTGWESLPAILNVAISIGGGPFTALGSQTLASVPYALYALKSGGGGGIPPGTRNGQTLRWDTIPMAWVADNNLTNDGSHVGIGLYPAGLRSRLHVTTNAAVDTTVIFGFHSNIPARGAGLRSIVVGNTNFNPDPFATGVYGAHHSAVNLGGGLAAGNFGYGNSNGTAIGLMGIGFAAGPSATATGIYATAVGAPGAQKMAALFDQGSVYFKDSIFIGGSSIVGANIGNVLTLSSSGRAKWAPVPGGISSIATSGPLTGGPITSSGTISLLPSGVSPGPYGGAPNVVPFFNVDIYGRITSAGSNTVATNTPTIIGIGTSTVTSAGNNFTVNTPPVNLSYAPVTGILSYSPAAGANTLNISPNITFTNNVLTVGSNTAVINGTGLWTRPTVTATAISNMGDYLGIGTNSPVYKIDAVGPGANFISSRSTNAVTGFMLDRPSNAVNGYYVHRTGGVDDWVVGSLAGNSNYVIHNWLPNRTDISINYSNGFVGVGTVTPLSRLHVAGQLSVVDGSQANGRVLVSNGVGQATWQDRVSTITSAIPPGCQSLASVNTTSTQLGGNLVTFTKNNAATNVEVTFQTFINVGSLNAPALGVYYELRVDGLPAPNSAGKTIYFRNNGGISTVNNEHVNMFASFPGLSAGAHTVTVYVYTISGSASSVFYDPGCWNSSNVTVKEFW